MSLTVHIYTRGILSTYEKKHRELPGEITKLLANYSPRVEIYGDQEFFLDLTGEKNVGNLLNELCKKLVPGFCDSLIISLAKTRLTARACSLAVAYLPQQSWQEHVSLEKLDKNTLIASVNSKEAAFWARMPVRLLWPLDAKAIKQLQLLGLNTCGPLQQLPVDELARHFGSQAGLIHRLSHGLDHSSIPLAKTSSRLTRFHLLNHSTDRHQWKKAAEEASHSLGSELALRLEGFRELKLTLVGESGFSKTENRRFNRLLFTPSAIKTNLFFLLDRMQFSEPVYSMTVCLAGIHPVPTAQMELFCEGAVQNKRIDEYRKKRLGDVIKNLNRKYPSRLITFGSNLALSRREQMLQFWDPLRFIR